MNCCCTCRPDFEKMAATPRSFEDADRALVGPVPTIALTPTADGRNGAYDDNDPRKPVPQPGLPGTQFIAFDFETTGLNPFLDRIVEVVAVADTVAHC